MARAYWDFRDQLSTDEGLLLMGPCIAILSCLWEEYLEKLHHGHLSATKVQQNAHEHLCHSEFLNLRDFAHTAHGRYSLYFSVILQPLTV